MKLSIPVWPIAPEPLDKQWKRLTKYRLREIARLEWANAEKYYNAYDMEYQHHRYYRTKFHAVSRELAELKKEISDDGKPNRQRFGQTCPSCGSFSKQEGEGTREEASATKRSRCKSRSRARVNEPAVERRG